jgi:hypothetical protein
MARKIDRKRPEKRERRLSRYLSPSSSSSPPTTVRTGAKFGGWPSLYHLKRRRTNSTDWISITLVIVWSQLPILLAPHHRKRRSSLGVSGAQTVTKKQSTTSRIEERGGQGSSSQTFHCFSSFISSLFRTRWSTELMKKKTKR